MKNHVTHALIPAAFLLSATIAFGQTAVVPDNSQFRANFSGQSENLPMKNDVEEGGHARIDWFGHAVENILAGRVQGDTAPAVAGIKEPAGH